MSVQQVREELKKIPGAEVGHVIKFYFKELLEGLNTSKAVQLTEDDYNDYLTFFQALHPNAPTDWLHDYFHSIINKGYCWGVYHDDKLVSVTDAPDIPYMSETIVEPGINTLKEYRKRGFAKIVTGALIKFLLENNKVPIWSCGYNNAASTALAYSLGFRKLADVVTVTLDSK